MDFVFVPPSPGWQSAPLGSRMQGEESGLAVESSPPVAQAPATVRPWSPQASARAQAGPKPAGAFLHLPALLSVFCP